MKITLAQLNPTVGDLRTNAETILRIATQAAAEGIVSALVRRSPTVGLSCARVIFILLFGMLLMPLNKH